MVKTVIFSLIAIVVAFILLFFSYKNLKKGHRTVRGIFFVVPALIISWLLLYFGFAILQPSGYPRYTESIEDYNTEGYPIYVSIFPDSIPRNAEIVSFMHYNYWNESKDFYLEIKFNTAEDLEQYVSVLKEKYFEATEKMKPFSNYGWIAEQENPYQQGYVDLICTKYYSSTAYETYTGYEIVPSDGGFAYRCNFGVISYSYEDLTVIHSYAIGSFKKEVHNYIPKYFLRFNVPINDEHKRWLYLVE